MFNCSSTTVPKFPSFFICFFLALILLRSVINSKFINSVFNLNSLFVHVHEEDTNGIDNRGRGGEETSTHASTKKMIMMQDHSCCLLEVVYHIWRDLVVNLIDVLLEFYSLNMISFRIWYVKIFRNKVINR